MSIQTNEIWSCVKWIKVVELYRLDMTFYSLKHYDLFLVLLLHRGFKANINYELVFLFSDNRLYIQTNWNKLIVTFNFVNKNVSVLYMSVFLRTLKLGNSL